MATSIEIAIPFHLAPDGRIATETDPDRQVKQHVDSLVSTEPGERVMLPAYGVPLTSMLFEPDDDLTTSILTQQVTTALARWEPGVRVLGVQPRSGQPGDGISGVNVQYQRTESPRTPIIGQKLNTAVISNSGEVSEVVRG